MDDSQEKSRANRFARDHAGLCADCVNAEPIQSNRGSLFLLCRLSRSDPRFSKYPRLPVWACSGHVPRSA